VVHWRCTSLFLPPPADTCVPTVAAVRAVAADAGQPGHCCCYELAFHHLSHSYVRRPQPCAQVLLTQDNLGIRSQYLNARNTFTELFAYGTVPIVNENDTVAVEQVRFGDNDTLAAQVGRLFSQSTSTAGCWQGAVARGHRCH